MRSFLFFILLISTTNCSDNSQSTDTKEISAAKFLNGQYEKIKEVLVSDNCWIKIYRDSITEFYKLLFVKQTETSKVLDTLNIGTLKKGQYVSLASVKLNGITDPELIVVCQLEKNNTETGIQILYESTDHILKAWRADVDAGKLRIESTQNIQTIEVLH